MTQASLNLEWACHFRIRRRLLFFFLQTASAGLAVCYMVTRCVAAVAAKPSWLMSQTEGAAQTEASCGSHLPTSPGSPVSPSSPGSTVPCPKRGHGVAVAVFALRRFFHTAGAAVAAFERGRVVFGSRSSHGWSSASKLRMELYCVAAEQATR